MKKNIYIIVDVSGSMNDMGKIFIQQNLCRYISQQQFFEQESYLSFDVHYFQWASHITEFFLQNDKDIPAMKSYGTTNFTVLSEFIRELQNKKEKATLLILSDGNFSNSEIMCFLEYIKSYHELIIHTVAVGADADILKLKKISTRDIVYLSENISSALNCALHGDNKQINLPENLFNILKSETNDLKDCEEDWDA